ncbi:MAG: hypothetical protein PUP91_27510 [Rhizonema sp. PD37]|nr:hypothetical protein [Rhizonema sp. PD37]
MTEAIPQKPAHRPGRIFPEITISPEELAIRKAEGAAFSQRCRAIFDRLLPELIDKYYGWYIAIEPDSGDYFIDVDEEVASLEARQKYPDIIHHMFGINETGATGTI